MHYVGVVRIFGRWNREFVGIAILSQIISTSTRDHRLHEKLADFGHLRLGWNSHSMRFDRERKKHMVLEMKSVGGS
jgi:hypothetical protein